MVRRLATPWLLIASLLFGLWAVAAHAHDGDHAGAAPHAEVCAICVFASGAAGALPSAGFVLFLLALAGTPFRSPVAAPRTAHRALVRARGPPAFLA